MLIVALFVTVSTSPMIVAVVAEMLVLVAKVAAVAVDGTAVLVDRSNRSVDGRLPHSRLTHHLHAAVDDVAPHPPPPRCDD